jgi:hypothetical protein
MFTRRQIVRADGQSDQIIIIILLDSWHRAKNFPSLQKCHTKCESRSALVYVNLVHDIHAPKQVDMMYNSCFSKEYMIPKNAVLVEESQNVIN